MKFNKIMFLINKQVTLYLCIITLITRLFFWIRSRISFVSSKKLSNVIKNKIVYDGENDHKVKLLVVLGSGGHTSELLMLINDMDLKNKVSLTCIFAKSDLFSKERALLSLSKSMSLNIDDIQNYVDFHCISRSREVNQSYCTSLLTTIISLFESLLFLYNKKYDLILVNGPGTCIPICIGSLILEVSVIKL
ncbi:secreted glycosyltransferase transmembrane domain near C-terminus [Cryptosporidium bovis]|uniref:secreted glycosyltransferase transmembrane domain near C-terminus n=1 Tax=Cryptosporidium bovis TaxID=310047 RepID=UPI00351A32FB|nr:secreted glycosyltransferase transmembrane domain near C-terminus [Cryptosporidium bovis]